MYSRTVSELSVLHLLPQKSIAKPQSFKSDLQSFEAWRFGLAGVPQGQALGVLPLPLLLASAWPAEVWVEFLTVSYRTNSQRADRSLPCPVLSEVHLAPVIRKKARWRKG
jgi:hypothetical protein